MDDGYWGGQFEAKGVNLHLRADSINTLNGTVMIFPPQASFTAKSRYLGGNFPSVEAHTHQAQWSTHIVGVEIHQAPCM